MSDNDTLKVRASSPPVLNETSLPPAPDAISTAALHRIVDAVPSLVSYVDAGYRFRFANQAYVEWFGLTLENVIGHPVDEVLGDAAFAQVRPYLAVVLERGEPVMYEVEMAYMRGGRRFVHTDMTPDFGPDGTVRGLVAVITDITGRRRAEEALERREREFAALVENSPDIICRWDRELRCEYVSPSITMIAGLPQEHFLGKTHEEMGLPPETARIASDGLREIFTTRQPGNVSFTMPDSTGALRHYDASGVPLFAADGSVEFVMTVARDVSERIRIAEQNATLLRAQAESALLQRARVREVLFSVSEGRFRLCQYPDELPPRQPTLVGDAISLAAPTLARLRDNARRALLTAGFDLERSQDFVTAAGEAAMNAVVHANGGSGTIRLSADNAVIQVWVEDRGEGIPEYDLHKTFRRGYSSKGTLGHGFWLMLRLADRVHMLTGTSGTTVVVEMDRVPSDPLWLQER